MPFPDLTALGFSAGEDSSKFQEQPIDPSIQYETEGGVYLSRPRYTRDPGTIYTTAFTNITEADKVLLVSYYKTLLGGSQAFNYVHPVTGSTISVRFKSPFKTQYMGMGGHHRWDVTDITLQSV